MRRGFALILQSMNPLSTVIQVGRNIGGSTVLRTIEPLQHIQEISVATDKKTVDVNTLATIPTVEGTCPMPDIAALIGGKWKLIILQLLIFQGTHRFGELKKKIDGVTQTMLTTQLRALESNGLVYRKVYAEVPPRVEYSATDRALDLESMFRCMHDWWIRNGD